MSKGAAGRHAYQTAWLMLLSCCASLAGLEDRTLTGDNSTGVGGSQSTSADSSGGSSTGGSGGASSSTCTDFPCWPDSPTSYCVSSDGSPVDCDAIQEGESGYGQDGHYRISIPEYEGTEEITDSQTGLVWKEASVEAADAIEANDACNVMGYRLPIRLEFASLLDFGTENFSSSSLISSVDYWTSSSYNDNDYEWWMFVVSEGRFSITNNGMAHSVLCVDGDPIPFPKLTKPGQAWLDQSSGFFWMSNSISKSWDSARSTCESLIVGENEDWRLPSIKELETIATPVDAMEQILGNSVGAVWSSTPSPMAQGFYSMEVGDPFYNVQEATISNWVICVQGSMF